MSTALVRLVTPDDAAGLAAIYAPYVASTAISFETTPPSAEEMARRLALVERHAFWLVCEVEGTLAGYAYLSHHHERDAYRWSVDSAVYVAQARRRQGIGRGLYATLFELARLQGFRAVHAGITLPNAASVGLHEGLGFQPVGVYRKVGYKRGAWHDVGYWQLELRGRSAEPEPVTPPERVQRERPEQWTAAFEAGRALLQPSVAERH